MATMFQRIGRRLVGPTGMLRTTRHNRPLGDGPTRRERIVRTSLAVGGVLLALLLLLVTCGPPADRKSDKAGPGVSVPTASASASSAPRIPQLVVPDTYDTTNGWDITDSSPTYAVAQSSGLIAYLARTDDDEYLIRTINPKNGKPAWDGEPRRTLYPPDRFPRLLSVSADPVRKAEEPAGEKAGDKAGDKGGDKGGDKKDDKKKDDEKDDKAKDDANAKDGEKAKDDAQAKDGDKGKDGENAQGAQDAKGDGKQDAPEEQEAQEYFVTWSYGRVDQGPGQPSDSFISLDIFRASDGRARRIELPWPDPPKITASGPSILISDGKATTAVIDPAKGDIVSVPPGALGYPKECKECRTLTQVRGTTPKGLLVSGAKEFWVRGGWYSRKVAPKDADPATGVPASQAGGYILATWQKKKEAKDARTHELWVLHDAATGKAVLQARCRKPAIRSAEDPQLVISRDGEYLVAGRLAFDLREKRAYCFEEEDGTRPLMLTTVTDDGTAYGARSARSASDALAGGGSAPVVVDLTTATPETMALNVRIPGAEIAGIGLFRWTDGKDRSHLTGYPHRQEPGQEQEPAPEETPVPEPGRSGEDGQGNGQGDGQGNGQGNGQVQEDGAGGVS
ncbi:hypothetical protein AB0O07_12970 [Streptomyces sp. NPDC093085]|uniref:hypothetical protein n=1 Tax=Streptomyces sp. NPDC093085 TaxID=3155068 RepID=UPI003424BD9A